MERWIRNTSIVLLVGLLLGTSDGSAQAKDGAAAADRALEELEIVAEEAYYYAYPLLIMETTRAQATNYAKATTIIGRGPMNRWTHARSYPDASFTDVVRPNADTLYSNAWVDLRSGPMVVTVPDSGGRYYMLPFLDMWSEIFACTGTRTTGNGAQTFALVGPGWRGRLPRGLKRIDAPTPIVWCIGRTQTNGPSDYKAVHKFQDGLGLAPLACWCRGRSGGATAGRVDPAIDMKMPPVKQVAALAPVAFFKRFAQLWRLHPAHFNDQPIRARMARVGLIRGRSLGGIQFSDEEKAALARGIAKAKKNIVDGLAGLGRVVDGWMGINENMGTWSTQYARRAMVAFGGLGANVPEDAVYPTSMASPDGKPYDGNKKYVLRFEKEQIPPVNAFWSLTIYNERQLFVDNPISRYAIGDRSGLQADTDGSVTLYIQREDPGGDKTANWLPSPDGPFTLNMRLYWPKQSVLAGSWNTPPVKLAD